MTTDISLPGEATGVQALDPLAPLKAVPQWIVVMLVPLADGKTEKLPIDYRTGNVTAKGADGAHSPAIWLDYATAAATAAAWGASFTTGFVLTADAGLFCVDIDSCAIDGQWSPAALAIIAELPGTAVEVSQSGRGLHIWGRGPVPPHSMKREVHGIRCELYSDRRFIASGLPGATGDMRQPCPTVAAFVARHFPPREAAATVPDAGPVPEWSGPVDDDELIHRAMRSHSAGGVFGGRASFADLWTGDVSALASAYPSTHDAFDRSSADAALAQRLAWWTGKDVARIERLMRRSALVREKWDQRDDYLVERTIRGACARQVDVLQDKRPAPLVTAGAAPQMAPSDRDHVMIVAEDPLQTARELIAHRYTRNDQPALKYWQGSFYRWTGSRWMESPDADIRAAVYSFIDDRGFSMFRPTARRVSDVVDALKAAANLDASHSPPCWMSRAEAPAAAELVACSNGLLHLPSRTLHPPSPLLFNLNAAPFAFDPRAPAPAAWLKFLSALWPNDPEAIATLQEMFGYMLTPDTRQQKLFLIVGPKRSGKGTIARVLGAMLGPDNVAAPTLSGLGTQFGLASLVGKLAAIVSDARLGSRTDPKLIAENLLRVSGEDRVEIDRKNRDPLTLKLGVRFLLLTNELPKLADASGAMASRFIVLTMSESFFGREDPGLTAKLLPELPGILAWAVEGWHRLHARGYFAPPRSSAEAVQDLADLGSPIGAFIRSECVTGPTAEAEVKALFGAWRLWCIEQGITHAGSLQSFGRDLKASLPGLTTTQARTGSDRIRVYRGVSLRPGTQWHAIHSNAEGPEGVAGTR